MSWEFNDGTTNGWIAEKSIELTPREDGSLHCMNTNEDPYLTYYFENEGPSGAIMIIMRAKFDIDVSVNTSGETWTGSASFTDQAPGNLT